MSTVSRVQHLLGVIAHAKVDNHPVPMLASRIGKDADALQPAAPVQDGLPAQPASAAAWDPHEVWVNRVKKPRDQRPA